jgi:hypothetical protein
MEIRSFRNVFALERRIYRIDRVRLNPGGIPLRTVAYLLAMLLLAVLASRVSLLAGVAARVPWYLRELALPAIGAALLSLIRIDGRPFHLAAYALARCASASGSSARTPWRPQPIVMLPDGSDARFRRMRYGGPGAVLVSVPHRRELSIGALSASAGRAPTLTVRAPTGRRREAAGQVIVLEHAGRLNVL